MRNSLLALSLVSCAWVSSAPMAAEKDEKSIEEYRCLAPRDCQFEQWFVNSSVGYARGDLSQQDVVDDAAALGFEVFDVAVDDERFAYKLGLGLHISQDWEAEAGFVDLGEVSTAFTTLTSQPDDFFEQTNTIRPLSASGPFVSAKYKLINDVDWQVGLKAGLFFWDGDFESLDVFGNVPLQNVTDSSGTDMFYGIGLAYSLSEQINLSAEWERYQFSEEDTDLLSLGLRYYF